MSIYTMREIADRIRPIAESYSIDRVYLFGSYARGEATEDSGIDFYIEMSRPLGLCYCSLCEDLRNSVGKRIDIITKNGLYNPATLKDNASLIQRISMEKRCIYES